MNTEHWLWVLLLCAVLLNLVSIWCSKTSFDRSIKMTNDAIAIIEKYEKGIRVSVVIPGDYDIRFLKDGPKIQRMR